jgi:hypothetical protein
LLATAAAEGAAEDRFEDVAEVAEALGPRAAAHAAVLESLVAIAVIGRALLRVLQAIIGLADRLEARFGILAARILVRVITHGKLAVRRLDRCIVRTALDFQQFVKINFG